MSRFWRTPLLAFTLLMALAEPILAQAPRSAPAGTPSRPGAPASTPAPRPGPPEIVNIDAGKTGEQLFKANCAVCHKSAAGLSKAGGLLGVQSFLRSHYTASRESAAIIGAYLYSIDATTPARPARQRANPDAKRPSKKPADAKPADAKPAETKPADATPTAAKSEEPPRPPASLPTESKPAEAPAPADSKPAASAEQKPADAPKAE